jgi:TonB family protein
MKPLVFAALVSGLAACASANPAPPAAAEPAPAAAAASRGSAYTLVTDASLGSDDPTAVWLVRAVTDRPRMMRPVPLVYPDSLRRRGVRGSAVVEFIVDTLGRVEPEVRVVESTHPALADPARRTILPARFRPGHVRGRKVRVLMTLRFQFTPSTPSSPSTPSTRP